MVLVMPRKKRAGRPRLPKGQKRKKVNMTLDRKTLAFLDSLIELGIIQSKSQFIDDMAKVYAKTLQKSLEIINNFNDKASISQEDLPKLLKRMIEAMLEDLKKIAIDFTTRHIKLIFDLKARKKAEKIKIKT